MPTPVTSSVNVPSKPFPSALSGVAVTPRPEALGNISMAFDHTVSDAQWWASSITQRETFLNQDSVRLMIVLTPATATSLCGLKYERPTASICSLTHNLTTLSGAIILWNIPFTANVLDIWDTSSCRCAIATDAPGWFFIMCEKHTVLPAPVGSTSITLRFDFHASYTLLIEWFW